jgi:long-chain fatty acid transport protein
MMRFPARWAPLSVLALALPLDAAEGMRVIGFGPDQTATSGAGLASPQDSTWLAINPASLVELGGRIDIDASDIHPTDSLTPAGPIGNHSDGSLDDSRNIILPDLTAAEPVAGGVLGLGIYTIGGLAIDLPAARSTIGEAGGFDRRAAADVLTAAIGYGHEVVAGWAIGAALLGDYADFRSDGLTRFGTETQGDYRLDHALGAGFSLGIHKHWSDVSVGIAYTSRQWMQRFGMYRDLLDSSFDQPQIVQIGIAWRPTSWLEPLLDYRYIDWHGVKVFGDANTGFGWKSQNIFKIGLHAHASDSVTVHAGFSYGRSPIDSSEVFTNGLSPLITEAHLSIGVTWEISAQYHVECAYLHGFRNTLTDNGSDAGGAGAGTQITLAVDEVSLGLAYCY